MKNNGWKKSKSNSTWAAAKGAVRLKMSWRSSRWKMTLSQKERGEKN